ncbi:nitrogen-fixing NifU domain protein [Salinarchaeum sp. Harcht-Bsk1]|uniref:iron-sulfur cluster biogenesis protein NfuA n=1 Tax=Salinarchaeum sp. Harcht-Bsk1 TaxID=1333523 RepID=UPI00034249C8|nr:iron-sulfur cluster biogenesis protein NfuA [Salinarchaeum sp. Harcht-Bsk1]AGN01608.1 nitrogen-fixing NifU domain protein [Salinarchaeum sp. Harcht-Bsk1]
MSTETQEGDDLEERVANFLRRNFPQIQMHGGSAAIQDLDRETGEVTIQLGGACSGCGISPMTIQAIKSRMVQEIPEIEQVHASTGMDGGGHGGGGMSPSFPGEDAGGEESTEDEGPQAPF